MMEGGAVVEGGDRTAGTGACRWSIKMMVAAVTKQHLLQHSSRLKWQIFRSERLCRLRTRHHSGCGRSQQGVPILTACAGIRSRAMSLGLQQLLHEIPTNNISINFNNFQSISITFIYFERSLNKMSSVRKNTLHGQQHRLAMTSLDVKR